MTCRHAWYGRTAVLLLVPLYTVLFIPSEYAVLSEMYAYAAFFMALGSCGMETAFFRFFGVSLKPSCSVHFTIFGLPPANKTISGYDTQKGAGIITSSPLLRVAMKAL